MAAAAAAAAQGGGSFAGRIGLTAAALGATGFTITGMWYAVARRGTAVPVFPHDDAAEVRVQVVERTPCLAIPGHDVVVRDHTVHPQTLAQTAAFQLRRSAPAVTQQGFVSWCAASATLLTARVLGNGEDTAAAAATAAGSALPPERYRSLVLEPRKGSVPSVDFAAAAGISASDALDAALTAVFSSATQQSLVKCKNTDAPISTTADGASSAPRHLVSIAAPQVDCIPEAEYLCPMYLRVMLAATAVEGRGAEAGQAAPNRRFAVLGAGGGALPAFLESFVPHGTLDLVDAEPEMLRLTPRLAPGGPGQSTRPVVNMVAADAAAFIRQAVADSVQYDAIFSDIYVGSKVPEEFTSGPFLSEVRESLTSAGVAAFNLPARDPQFLVAAREVFGAANVLAVPVPHGSSNCVVLCAKDDVLPQRLVAKACSRWSRQLDLPIDIGCHVPVAWRWSVM
jgi:SAM-dependent methyltransferase